MMMTVNAILNRINYTGPRTPTLETLQGLMRQYLYSVPFENLDIHLGRPIRMELPHLFHKIVTQKRGGFCYESNLLFHDLLLRLGFDVTILSARMVFNGVVLPEFVHVTLLVKLDRPYLADVANGQSFRQPLPLDGSVADHNEGRQYVLGQHEGHHALLLREGDGPWTPRFLYTLTPRTVADFEAMCRDTQSSPESFFVQHRLATIATPAGRRTLMDQRFAIEENGSRQETTVTSEDQFHQILRSQYDIELHNASLNWQATPTATTSL
jgi:N-hydroxyarylamine O-acetyltransferase